MRNFRLQSTIAILAISFLTTEDMFHLALGQRYSTTTLIFLYKQQYVPLSDRSLVRGRFPVWKGKMFDGQ
jgi:hypothetical protein